MIPDSEDVPELFGPDGKVPRLWLDLVSRIGEVDVDSRAGVQLQAQLRVWTLFADLRTRQILHSQAMQEQKLQAASMHKQARALTVATWVLAFATVGLMVATVVLVAKQP